MLRRGDRPESEVLALNNLAVALAKHAGRLGRPNLLVAGSIAPLEDCYSPWLSPPFAEALTEHREQATVLANAGVDVLMVETMPLVAEAVAAARAALETGLPTTVGFVLGDDGRLLSGETIGEAVARVAPLGVAAIIVNCSPRAVIARALPELRRLTELPLGAYANLGVAEPTTGWTADASVDGDHYAVDALGWIDAGARIVGGCCGTRPAHIDALRRAMDGRQAGAEG